MKASKNINVVKQINNEMNVSNKVEKKPKTAAKVGYGMDLKAPKLTQDYAAIEDAKIEYRAPKIDSGLEKRIESTYSDFQTSLITTAQIGCKLGGLLIDLLNVFLGANKSLNEQTVRKHFNQYVEERFKIGKDQKALLMRIAGDANVSESIENGEITSIREAKKVLDAKNEKTGRAEKQAPKSDFEKQLDNLVALQKIGLFNKSEFDALKSKLARIMKVTIEVTNKNVKGA